MKKLLLISLLLLIACSQIRYVEINDVKIPVEIAITQQEKEKGLISRTNLTGGMLFIYNDEAQRYFWMKDTLIPLDIIFIGSNNKITAIHHAVPCKTESCTIYPGFGKYVLEVNYNFTTKNNIKTGDNVTLIK